MMTSIVSFRTFFSVEAPVRLAVALIGLAAVVLFALSPVKAQDLETFDPGASQQTQADNASGAIDADLVDPGVAVTPVENGSNPVPVEASGGDKTTASVEPGFDGEFEAYSKSPADAQGGAQWVDPASGATVGEGGVQADAQVAEADASKYAEDDLIGAAEGVFGKGAEGLAKMIEDLLKKEGKPNGYIVGREAGGAFIVGARYGSGTLHHKIEGERKVYWTGPSVGFDAGANAANTFVLVYNLYDSEDLFKRYPAGEGQAYLVGGLHASYMRRGDVVLIPIRLGAGLRLGVNAGYMKFSKKQRWLPF